MIKHLDIDNKSIVESTRGAGQILVVSAPDDNERDVVREQCALDTYDMNSTLDPDEVPRVDFTDGRLFLIWKVPEAASVSDAIDLAVSTVGLSLLEDRLVFVQRTADVSFADKEFRKVGDVKDTLLAFLLRTVHHFVGHLRVIKQISNELEKKITVSMENKHLLQMFALSESLIYYLDAVEGNGAALTKLRSIGGQLGFEARHLEMLDDIILENAQAARQASIYSSVLSGLMDARGTIVNNNMNVLLKNLTLITIVFLPLNLIASIGGMSEWSMMTRGIRWSVSYGLFCLGMVVLGWGTWVLMKRAIVKVPQRAQKSAAAASLERSSQRR